MNRIHLAVAATAAASFVVGAPLAHAETVTMAGTLGVQPDYPTITAGGVSLCPCDELVVPTTPDNASIEQGQQVLHDWLAEPSTTPKVVLAYSLSTEMVRREFLDSPKSTQDVEFYLFGAPSTHGNGSTFGVAPPEFPDEDLSNTTVVVRQYDPVADVAQRPNVYSWMNAKMSTHINGYNGIDLDNPDAVYVDPETGATTQYYRSDVLPMLKWAEPWISEEKMAELDAKYRPLVEEAYDRPVEISDPEPSAASLRAEAKLQAQEDQKAEKKAERKAQRQERAEKRKSARAERQQARKERREHRAAKRAERRHSREK